MSENAALVFPVCKPLHILLKNKHRRCIMLTLFYLHYAFKEKLMNKKIVNKQPNATECFVCGLQNDKGLKACFFETDDDQIAGIFTPHRLHQSYPGRLHGGIAASILDETIGRAIQIGAPDSWGVTVELTLAYKKPLPYDVELKSLGRITRDSKRIFEGEGEIYTPDGAVAVTAKAKYVKMSIGKISEEFDDKDWKVHLHIDDPEEINIG